MQNLMQVDVPAVSHCVERMVDGLLVAKGEADVLVSTQLLPMEHALLTLLLQESGAVVQLLSDRALLAGNAKLVAALAERLPKL